MSIENEFGTALVNNLVSRASFLLAFAERLSAGSYPSEGPRHLINFLSSATRGALEELERLRTLPYSEVEVTALRLGGLLTVLHVLLEYIAQAQTSDVPEPMVPLLEAIVRRHTESASIIVRFTWEFNYSIEELTFTLKDIAKYAPFLAKAMTDFPAFLPVFSFPRTARDDTLLHAAFGHEIGHFIGWARRIHEEVKPILIDPALLSAVPPALHGPLLRTILFWFRELIADVIGIHLFGPAAFLAFATVTLHALNEPGSRHPPPAVRLRLMLSVLRDLGYLDRLRSNGSVEAQGKLPIAYRELFRRWEEFLKAHHEAPADPFYVLITQSATAAEPTIKEQVRRLIGARTYPPDDAVQKAGPLVARLRTLVPPDEDAPDLVSILNAGWHVSALEMDSLYNVLSAATPEQRLAVSHKLNDLLAKALENTVLMRLWQVANAPGQKDQD